MKRGRWHNHDTASWALPEGWRYCPREGAIYHPVKGGWRWREPDHYGERKRAEEKSGEEEGRG